VANRRTRHSDPLLGQCLTEDNVDPTEFSSNEPAGNSTFVLYRSNESIASATPQAIEPPGSAPQPQLRGGGRRGYLAAALTLLTLGGSVVVAIALALVLLGLTALIVAATLL
jgi:hypothetical protein